ncbi:putative NOC2 family protein [Smittium mucronatum]|uniref:Putative NOC2 family protein n=1 Tax=Smittium mucronatum TaxID=133383 RepID=A0A1R0H1A9_9FUNG|nr:putative NOC2 family protein [Smittium mucronatum]
MAKVKKAQRKFNLKTKKASISKPTKKEEVVGKKNDKSGTTKKINQKTKPGTLPRQKATKAVDKDAKKTIKQTRPDRLVKELFTKDNEEAFSDEELEEFVNSQPKFKENFNPDIDIDFTDSEESGDEPSKNDDIFDMLDIEYESAEDEPEETTTPAPVVKGESKAKKDTSNQKKDSKEAKKVKKQENVKNSNSETKNKDSEKLNPDNIEDISVAAEKLINKKSLEKIDNEAKKIQQTIEDLQEKDPEFYEFMKQNDPSALEFDLVSDEEVSDDESQENSDSEELTNSSAIALTEDIISGWKSKLEANNSVNALRQAIIAFKSASNIENKQDENNEYKYSVRGETEFHQLMMLCMTQVPIALQYHVPFVTLDKNQNSSSKGKSQNSNYKAIIEKNKKWKPLKPFVFSYLDSYMMTIKQITDSTMLSFVLSQSSTFTPYFLCFPKLVRTYVRELMRLFGLSSSDDTVVVSSLLALRRLAGVEKQSTSSVLASSNI